MHFEAFGSFKDAVQGLVGIICCCEECNRASSEAHYFRHLAADEEIPEVLKNELEDLGGCDEALDAIWQCWQPPLSGLNARRSWGSSVRHDYLVSQ